MTCRAFRHATLAVCGVCCGRACLWSLGMGDICMSGWYTTGCSSTLPASVVAAAAAERSLVQELLLVSRRVWVCTRQGVSSSISAACCDDECRHAQTSRRVLKDRSQPGTTAVANCHAFSSFICSFIEQTRNLLAAVHMS